LLDMHIFSCFIHFISICFYVLQRIAFKYVFPRIQTPWFSSQERAHKHTHTQTQTQTHKIAQYIWQRFCRLETVVLEVSGMSAVFELINNKCFQNYIT